MNEREERAIPEPSTLPPNPSVGELVTEIDRARHETARTLNALARKFDAQAARTPVAVARSMTTAGKSMGYVVRYARRVPVPVWIVVVLGLMIWRHRRSRS